MSVTDGDRERAAELMNAWDVDDGATYLDLEATIAAALAEVREKARAPFLALAEEYAERSEKVADGFWKRHLWIVAQRLRTAEDA